MCAGATVLARVERVVSGADDQKAGAAGSPLGRRPRPPAQPPPRGVAGVLAEESAALLDEFFRDQRT